MKGRYFSQMLAAVIWAWALMSPPIASFCFVPLPSQNKRQRWPPQCYARPSRTDLSSYHRTGNDQQDEDDSREIHGIRLNKVFKANYSRRQADALIESGRVSVNGKPVEEKGGFRVLPFVDTIALDGVVIEGWEDMNGIGIVDERTNKTRGGPNAVKIQKNGFLNSKENPTIISSKKIMTKTTNNFEYIKFWKPRGVTCTTDRSISSNIIDDLIQRRGYQPKHRVYPVGRLDKDTSGLILLTSDGRLPNSALRGQFKQPKVYRVLVDKPLSDQDLHQLRNGVVITTVAQRIGNNRGKALTAPTLPCRVERIPGTKQRGVTITLVEGRNRQIRKMMVALEYEVVELHRIEFMGIGLDPLKQAGEWTSLDNTELQLVDHVLQRAATNID